MRTALRTDPPTDPGVGRVLPPRRDRPLRHAPPRPRRQADRSPGAPHRDSQGPQRPQRREARQGPRIAAADRRSLTSVVQIGAQGQGGWWEEDARRRGRAPCASRPTAQGGAQVQRREAGARGCAEGEGAEGAAAGGVMSLARAQSLRRRLMVLLGSLPDKL